MIIRTVQMCTDPEVRLLLMSSGFLPLFFSQEHLNYVTEISQEELYILDPELVLKETVGTSPGMPDLVDSEEHQDQQRQFAFPCSPSSPTSSNDPR